MRNFVKMTFFPCYWTRCWFFPLAWSSALLKVLRCLTAHENNINGLHLQSESHSNNTATTRKIGRCRKEEMESNETSQKMKPFANEEENNATASEARWSQTANTATPSEPGNAGSAVLMQFLQPPGSSLPLVGNLSGVRSQGFNQQMALDSLMSAFTCRRQGIGMDPLYLQQLLARQTGNPMLAQRQNTGATLNSFLLPPTNLWAMNSLAQTTNPQRVRPKLYGIQHTLATITSATGGANGTPIANDALPLQAEQQVGSTSGASSGGRGPVVVYMDCDEEALSDYQCLLRKQIELFEATFDDVQWNAQGRNKAIVMGQVGIRCRRCSRLATWARARGAVYYSTTLDGLYQAAQNMAKNHLCEHCRLIPADVKNQLLGLRDCKRRAGGGKTYWAEGARVLGVHETRNGLRFRNSKTGMEQAKKDNGAERIAGKKI